MKTMQAIMLSRLFVFLAMSGAGALGAAAQTRAIDVSGGRAVYAAMPHQTYLSAMSNMTAEAWINTTESSGPRFFFSKYASSSRTSGGEWYMGLEDGGMGMRVMVVPVGASGSASQRTFSLPYSYSDGEWHHVAFTYNESRIEVFYDGKSLGVNTSTTGPIRGKDVAVNVGVIFNGASPATDANSFIGLVGETRLWSTIRTEAQISANMRRRLRGDETGLVGYWPLNEAAGTVIYDRTSSANHGALVGAVRTATDLAIGFILANPVTGSTKYVHEGTADVAEFSTHAGYTHFQITEGTTAPEPGDWDVLANAPDGVSFTPPASDTPVTFTAWFTNTSASVVMLSDSATLLYTDTALPNAVAYESLSRLISPVPGSSLVIAAVELDNGSTGGTYGGDALDIVERRAILLDGPTANATPDETYVTVSGSGVYELALVVRNETGNVATSDVCTVTATTTSARYVVPAPGGSDANDGASWSQAWATLEHAVATATAGDLILATNGVHAVAGTLVLDKGVTLMGFGDAPSGTIVEPSSSRTNLVELSHAEARVENLTLRNGNTGARILGAGTVARCVITGCDNSGVRLVDGGLVSDCVISGNSASSGSGGGVHVDGGGATLRNCLIVGNSAPSGTGWGGGLYFGSGSVSTESVAENCTLVSNFAFDSGGGIRVYNSPPVTLRNCIVHGNRALNNGDNAFGSFQVYNTILAPVVTSGGTSIDVDPQFMDAASGDYRLRPGSPAIDAGATRPWMTGASLDLAGDPRTDGSAPDMGAFEYQTVPLDCALQPDRRAAFTPNASVQFSASVRGTDADDLIYAWDFDGDGETDLLGAEHDRPTHVYAEAGTWAVGLTVSNATGAAATYVYEQAVKTSPSVLYASLGGGAAEAHPYDSWEKAASSIQAAIDAAASGAVVRVSSEVHPLAATIEIRDGVTLRGDAGAVLDGQATVPCLYVEHPAAVVEGFTLKSGANGLGGGAYLYWGGTLRDCVVESCTTPGSLSAAAGGVYATGSRCLVAHSKLRNNSGGHLGAGGAVMNRNAVIRNCLVYGNWTRSGSSRNAGGVILLNGAVMESCTVVGNESFGATGAGGVYSQQGIRGKMVDSIVYFNRHDAGLNHDVANGFLSDSVNNIVGSLASVDILGAMTVDPEFRQNGAGYGETHQPGNYRPCYDSPAVDAGATLGWMAGAVDLDGNERIVDGAVDIGAFEVQPPQATIIVLR